MALPAASKIAIWQLELEDEDKAVAVPDPVEGLIYTSGTVDIGIFGPQKDVRTPASEVDFTARGKYHPILKLFIQHGASAMWKTATGWLSKDNIVVTAAHCVFDHGQRATRVQALIGYNADQENADISTVEQRSVKSIAAPLEWINAMSEQCDVAFLQLNSPFHNVKPIAYDAPEINTHQRLTVPGYPADLSVGGMPGGRMYEMKIDKNINLEQTKNNMLRYQGDTPGGLSGSPVIRESDFTAVGVHTSGGSINSAAIIGGPYGVRFQDFEDVIKALEEGGGTDTGFVMEADNAKDWLKYVRLPSKA